MLDFQNSPAYLHTISYSLEGLLESYLITNNESYLHAVLKGGMKRIIYYQTNNNRFYRRANCRFEAKIPF